MSKKAVVPGLYYFHNHQHYDGGPQMTGSQLTLTWAQCEPYKGKLSTAIDDWVEVERARGHPWVLRVDVHQNRGARSMPGWAPAVTLKMANGNPVLAPDYRNPTLQQHLCEFVQLLGARYDSAPDLVMVQIGLGLYGETHPERDDSEGGLLTQYTGGKLTGCEWIAYCKRIIDAYVAAFPNTELCIMNAPTYNVPCRETQPPYTSHWPRKVIDEYALSVGVGAQNNSLDEWDANWFTAETVGSNGAYTIDGCVSPFVEAGRMLAFERGSWLAPYGSASASWWAYLNGLSKRPRIIFPPNWAGKVLNTDGRTWYSYPSGVWDYHGPDADALHWMNDFALRSLRGELRWWFAFDAQHNPPAYAYGTAQHMDHELGVHRLTPMASEWGVGMGPFYEDKYRRKLAGAVQFETTPGRYRVTVWHRGAAALLGRVFDAAGWARHTFDADVPASFPVDGAGYLHGIILEPATEPPPPPDPPPDEEGPETYSIVTKAGVEITITVKGPTA